MRKSSKIIVAVAFAGLVVAGGSAFTGGGVTDTSTTPGFIGGSVSQNVTGAVLTGITYSYGTQAGVGTVTGAVVTFATGAEGKAVDIAFTGGGTTGTAFTCGAVAVDNTSTCTGSHTGAVDSVLVTVADA